MARRKLTAEERKAARVELEKRRYPEKRHHKNMQRLLRRYRLPFDEFVRMLVEQGGRCAICTKPMSGEKEPCIDHDHATDRVRALLCFSCNVSLGHFRDSPELLRRAADYLESHR